MAEAGARNSLKALDALFHPAALFVLLLLIAVRAFAGSATLAWDPVSSPALAGYVLYYGPAAGNYVSKIDVGNTTTRTVSSLTEGATYHFAVTAYDASHTETAFSNDASTTIPYAAPAADFSASATSGVAPLALNFINASTGSISSYAWTFGDGTSSTVQSPSHVYSAAGAYTVSLTVTGSGGSNTNTKSNYVTVTAPTSDTSPPTAPSSLAASASGSSGINLAWTASTDNVGVTGYRIERCQGAGCTTFAQIATSTGASFSNTGLAAGTSYSYRVRATDAAGNVSAYSNTATAVTAQPSGSPTLAGTWVVTAGNVNLTSVGASDWAQWPGYEHKAAGGQIGDLTLVAGGSVQTYTGDARTMTWSDGAPVATGSTNAGVSMNRTGSGFQITAPADATTRTLTVYVGAQNATGTLRAHLSDGSAVDYVSPYSAKRQRTDGAYTLTYRAASAGQTLTVTWTQSKGRGSVSMQGAALR